MAGLRGSQAYWLLGKQSAKGTAATAWKHRLFFTGGNLAPTRDTDQLQETDNSRDSGDLYVRQTSAGGTPACYLRDASAGALLTATLGTVASTGTTNYTHTITPGSALSYYSLGKMLGATLFENFTDAMVNELTISGDAGSPLTASVDWVGRGATRQAAEWTAGLAPPAADQGPVYNFNDATVTLGAGATALVSSFEMTITNNVTRQQTDDSVPYDVVPGLRDITLAFDIIFETLDEYNKFHYGGASGLTQVPTIFSTNATFLFSKGANNSISFDFPVIAYEEFPADPDASGDPVTVSARARVQRNGVNDRMTAVVKNQVATTI